VVGPLLIFLKRRLLLPLTRWLYEYSLENFRRQQKLNTVLLACIEELAIENAKLRRGQDGRDGRERQEGRDGPAFASDDASARQALEEGQARRTELRDTAAKSRRSSDEMRESEGG
jgi:hypothetical protein